MSAAISLSSTPAYIPSRKPMAKPKPREQGDIEALLVWTYKRQKADIVIGRGVGLHDLEARADGVQIVDVSACGVAAVARIGMLGTRIDQIGRDAGDLHHDAEVVHRAVMQMDGRVNGLPRSRLIIEHAARGERPDAKVGVVPRAYPYLNPRGDVVVEWLDKGRRYGVCRVQWSPSAVLIDAAREEYQAWHRALLQLASILSEGGKLQRWTLTPFKAPVAPWQLFPCTAHETLT